MVVVFVCHDRPRNKKYAHAIKGKQQVEGVHLSCNYQSRGFGYTYAQNRDDNFLMQSDLLALSVQNAYELQSDPGNPAINP